MRIEEIDTLLRTCAAQLDWARQTYAKALLLKSSDNPALRVAPLFDAASYPGGAALEAPPYAPVVPGVWAAYDGVKGLAVRIGPAPSRLAARDGACDLLFTAEGGEGLPRWLGLEIAVPWSFVRPARALTLGLFGETGPRESGAAKVTPSLFYHDPDGQKADLLKNARAVDLPQAQGLARMDAQIQLPAETRIDFARAPILALLFSPDLTSLQVSDLSIDFT
jgi:hypothetical protein